MAIGIAPSSGFVSARNDELSLSELTKALHTMALEVRCWLQAGCELGTGRVMRSTVVPNGGSGFGTTTWADWT